ncbi:FAD-binding domain-containing protein, partial [Parasphingorhabdus sp.]
DYIRLWVPELADIDDPYIHDPEEFGCRPAQYPAKIIGHKEARVRALEAYAEVK